MAQPSRRLLLLTTEYPPVVGGIGAFAHSIAEGLRLRGWDVRVLTTASSGMSRPIRLMTNTPRLILRSLLERGRGTPHVILAMTPTHEGIAATVLARIFRAPKVVIAAGTDVMLAQRSLLRRLVVANVLRGAAQVVAISEFTQQRVLNLGVSTENVHVVHPPVDPDDDRCPTGVPLSASLRTEGRVILLTASRLVRRKGHEAVLRALPGIVSKHPNVLYVMTGSGELQDDLAALVEQLNLAEFVAMPGFVSRSELAWLYSRAYVYVSPSIDDSGDVEGFGISFAEAATWGCPSLAGAAGGVEEVVVHNKTGLTVDGNDVDAIATALGQLLANPGIRESLGQGARDHVQKFSSRRQIDALDHILCLAKQD